MLIRNQISFDLVVQRMLAAGCFVGEESRAAATRLESPRDRYRSLVSSGYEFLRFVPQCDWFDAEVPAPESILNLLVICEESWLGRDLSVDRRVSALCALERLPMPHRCRVQAILARGVDCALLDRRITLFAHSKEGPFSILDGNHRLLALAHSLLFGRTRMQRFSVQIGVSHGPCRWHGDDVVWEERAPRNGRNRFVLRVW